MEEQYQMDFTNKDDLWYGVPAEEAKEFLTNEGKKTLEEYIVRGRNGWRHCVHTCQYFFHPHSTLVTIHDAEENELVKQLVDKPLKKIINSKGRYPIKVVGIPLGYLPYVSEKVQDELRASNSYPSEWLLLQNNSISTYQNWAKGFPTGKKVAKKELKTTSGLITYASLSGGYKWKHSYLADLPNPNYDSFSHFFLVCELDLLTAELSTVPAPPFVPYELSDFNDRRRRQGLPEFVPRDRDRNQVEECNGETLECVTADQEKFRVFQIGWSKAGTTSLYHFFDENGISAVHELMGILGTSAMSNFNLGRPLLTGIDNYTVYTNIDRLPNVRGNLFFKILDWQYPNSKFILNVRNVDNWVRSRSTYAKILPMEKRYFGVETTGTAEIVEMWRKMWDVHVESVREHFSDRPWKLIEFDIERDCGEDLVEFFKEEFPKLNASHWKQMRKSKVKKDEQI